MPGSEEQVTTLVEVYDYLKRFSLSDSLFIIGAVTATMRYGTKLLETADTPAPMVRWINDVAQNEIDRFALNVKMTRLARFLLLSRSNDYKNAVLDTGTQELHNAINVVSALHDKDVEGEPQNMHDMTRIFGRIGQVQFPLQADRTHLIGRGYLLFELIPKELKPPYDFDQKMKEYFGMSVFEYISTGLALWITCNGILKHNMMVEVDEMKGVVTKASVAKFVELSTGTAEDYRRMLRGDDWKTSNKKLDVYGLDPFVQIPAIKIEHSLRLEVGSYVVPQPHYLVQKATTGIFYLLADKEKAAAGAHAGRNYFRDSFGDVYRAYVGRHLALAQSPLVFIDFDKEIATPGMKPDFGIVADDLCILFEVKTALLTVTPRTIFDENLAREEVQRGGFKKAVDQLNSFEDEILAKKVDHPALQKIDKIIKVMVGFDDIYLANGFLLPILRESYGDKASNLQIATISDIETIGRILACKEDFATLMRKRNGKPRNRRMVSRCVSESKKH